MEKVTLPSGQEIEKEGKTHACIVQYLYDFISRSKEFVLPVHRNFAWLNTLICQMEYNNMRLSACAIY